METKILKERMHVIDAALIKLMKHIHDISALSPQLLVA